MKSRAVLITDDVTDLELCCAHLAIAEPLHQVDEGEAAAADFAQKFVLRLQQVYRFCLFVTHCHCSHYFKVSVSFLTTLIFE